MEKQQHKSTLSIVLLISNAVLGSFFFGYSLSYMNPALRTVDVQFDIVNNKIVLNGVINALPAIGAAIGALMSGILLTQMSLRSAFVITDLLGIVGCGLQLPLHLGTLLTARFIIGLGIGLNSSMIPLYIKEFSPKNLSGPLGAMNQLTVNCGILVALIMGVFFAQNGSSLEFMRFVFDFPMIICALRILFFSYFYRDSPPSYYICKGQYQAAKRVIKKLYKYEYVASIYDQIYFSNLSQTQSALKYSDLFTNKVLRKKLIIGCSLQIVQQLTGINAVLIYSSYIFNNITNNNNTVKNWLNIGVGLTNIVSSLIAIQILNRIGRRPVLLVGTLFCSISLTSKVINKIKNNITIVSHLMLEDQENKIYQYIIVFSIYAYLSAFQISLGPIGWIYAADILPDKGMSIAVSVNWLSCALVAQFFGIISDIGGLTLSFGIFTVCGYFGIGFIYFFIPETKDKSQNAIENMFSIVNENYVVN